MKSSRTSKLAGAKAMERSLAAVGSTAALEHSCQSASRPGQRRQALECPVECVLLGAELAHHRTGFQQMHQSVPCRQCIHQDVRAPYLRRSVSIAPRATRLLQALRQTSGLVGAPGSQRAAVDDLNDVGTVANPLTLAGIDSAPPRPVERMRQVDQPSENPDAVNSLVRG
jgi:hypothetical protein